jgi:hypothetical protein
MNADPKTNRWAGVWLDALAFAMGLGLAWWQAWESTDLVWSLWLSSLLVGYAMIVWRLSTPFCELLQGMRADRMAVERGGRAAVLAIVGAGTLFGLAFFTVHFGGFHFVHSVFLNQFFPITGHRPSSGLIDFSVYAEVVRRYIWFVPAAFLAERQAFRRPNSAPDTSVKAADIQARFARGDAMMAPYRNVVRMHLLIFFFAFAHFAHLENFAVYAVVYAVYFFPWSRLRRSAV